MPLDVENFFVDGMRPLPQLPSPKNWGEHMMERPSTSNGNEIPRRTPQWRDGPTRQRPSSSNGTELPRRTPKWHDGPERGGGGGGGGGGGAQDQSLVDGGSLEDYMLSSAMQNVPPQYYEPMHYGGFTPDLGGGGEYLEEDEDFIRGMSGGGGRRIRPDLPVLGPEEEDHGGGGGGGHGGGGVEAGGVPFSPRPPPSRPRTAASAASPSMQHRAHGTAAAAMHLRTSTQASTESTEVNPCPLAVKIKGCPTDSYNGKYRRGDATVNGAHCYKSSKGKFLYRTRTRQWALALSEKAMKRERSSFRTVTTSWGLILPYNNWERFVMEYRRELVCNTGRWRKCTGMEMVAASNPGAATAAAAAAAATTRFLGGAADTMDRWVENPGRSHTSGGGDGRGGGAPSWAAGTSASAFASGSAAQTQTEADNNNNNNSSSNHNHNHNHNHRFDSTHATLAAGPSKRSQGLRWEDDVFDALDADDAAAVAAALRRPGADPNAAVVDDGRIERGYFAFGKNGYRYNGRYERRDPLDYLTPKTETGFSAFAFLGMQVRHGDTVLDLAHRNKRSFEFRQAIRAAGGTCENVTAAEVAELRILGGPRAFPALFEKYDPCALLGLELETVMREAKAKELTDDPAIRVMVKYIASGAFVEEHFIEMFRSRIRKKHASEKIKASVSAIGTSKHLEKHHMHRRRNQRSRSKSSDRGAPAPVSVKASAKASAYKEKELKLRAEFQSLTGKNNTTIAQDKLFQLIEEFEEEIEGFVQGHKSDEEFKAIFGTGRKEGDDHRGGAGGKMFCGLTMRDVHAMFSAVDRDGDGIVSLDEFKEIVQGAGLKGRIQQQRVRARRRVALQGHMHTAENFTAAAAHGRDEDEDGQLDVDVGEKRVYLGS